MVGEETSTLLSFCLYQIDIIVVVYPHEQPPPPPPPAGEIQEADSTVQM